MGVKHVINPENRESNVFRRRKMEFIIHQGKIGKNICTDLLDVAPDPPRHHTDHPGFSLPTSAQLLKWILFFNVGWVYGALAVANETWELLRRKPFLVAS